MTQSSRDSVALTVGAVDWVRIVEKMPPVPHVTVLARYEWVNVNPVSLHSTLYEILWQRWKVDRCHCDATGIGSTSTAFLAGAINGKNYNDERIVAKAFDSAWNTQSELAFNYLAAVNGTHLIDYAANYDIMQTAYSDIAPADDPDKHAWWQRAHARLEAKPSKRVRAYVPEAEGHDDLIISEMLMVDAAYAAGQPLTRRKATSREY